jgi:tetratricopeptide (TPR) repeat protein
MALIKCPECNREISENALICPYCGIAIRGKFITCPECSRLVSINAKACPECGFPIKKELIRNSQNAEKANKLYATAQKFLKNQQEKEALSNIEEALQINPDESTFIALKQKIEAIIEKKLQSVEIFKDVQIAFEKGDLELSLSLVEKALQLYEDKEYVAFNEKLLVKKADTLKAEENYQTAKQAFEKDNFLRAYQTIKISCSLFVDNTLYLEFQKEIENRLSEQLYSQAKNSFEKKKYKDAVDKIAECLTYKPKVDVYIDLKERILSKMKRNKILKRVFIGVIVTVLLVIIVPRIVQTSNDKRAWNAAINENTVVAYNNYLRHYPKGIHFTQAKQERDSLITINNLELFPAVLNGKIGFVDKNWKVVIPGKYDLTYGFHENLAAVSLNGKNGFIDKHGHEVIPLRYGDAKDFQDGLAIVALHGKYGFIDKHGHEVTPIKYDYAYYFSDGLALVSLNNKYGFIDKQGHEVIPFKYDYAIDFQDGLACVGLNGKNGFIDKHGHEVIPLKYDRAGDFFDGLAAVSLNGKWGYIDKQGHEVIPLKYDNAYYFSDGLALVSLNNKYGFIDKQGHEVIPLKYDGALDNSFSDNSLYDGVHDSTYSFSDGLAAVSLNGKWGYIDQQGHEVIPLKYEQARDFQDGLAAVSINSKWGFIDKQGHEVIPLKYDYGGAFFDGLAGVTLNSKWGLIDKQGHEVIPFKDGYYVEYNSIGAGDFHDGLAWVELNGKFGIIDKKGNFMPNK